MNNINLYDYYESLFKVYFYAFVNMATVVNILDLNNVTCMYIMTIKTFCKYQYCSITDVHKFIIFEMWPPFF